MGEYLDRGRKYLGILELLSYHEFFSQVQTYRGLGVIVPLKSSVGLHELCDSHFPYNWDLGLLNENFPLVLPPKGVVTYMMSFLKSFVFLKRVKLFPVSSK